MRRGLTAAHAEDSGSQHLKRARSDTVSDRVGVEAQAMSLTRAHQSMLAGGNGLEFDVSLIHPPMLTTGCDNTDDEFWPGLVDL